jgi:hypothetical protein
MMSCRAAGKKSNLPGLESPSGQLPSNDYILLAPDIYSDSLYVLIHLRFTAKQQAIEAKSQSNVQPTAQKHAQAKSQCNVPPSTPAHQCAEC